MWKKIKKRHGKGGKNANWLPIVLNMRTSPRSQAREWTWAKHALIDMGQTSSTGPYEIYTSGRLLPSRSPTFKEVYFFSPNFKIE